MDYLVTTHSSPLHSLTALPGRGWYMKNKNICIAGYAGEGAAWIQAGHPLIKGLGFAESREEKTKGGPGKSFLACTKLVSR